MEDATPNWLTAGCATGGNWLTAALLSKRTGVSNKSELKLDGSIKITIPDTKVFLKYFNILILLFFYIVTFIPLHFFLPTIASFCMSVSTNIAEVSKK